MAGKNFNVTLPKKVEALIKLADDIKTKHLADGEQSPIPSTWIRELDSQITTAKAADTRQKTLTTTNKNQLELVNNELGLGLGQTTFWSDSVKATVSAIRDFLKGHFRDNPRALGEWGYTVKIPKKDVQIPIPRDAESLLKLAEKIVKKHTDDRADSLLKSYDI